MFSKISFSSQIKILIFGVVLAGLIAPLKTTITPVRAAEPQVINMVLPASNKVGQNMPIAKENRHIKPKIDIQKVVSFSSSKNPILLAEEWKSWDVIPSLSPRALSIYKKGIAMGNNPRAFSKVGDGEISAAWFLTDFDLGDGYYDLGAYTDLQAAIAYFSGSFARQGQAARRGFNVQRVLDPELAYTEICLTGESPLGCEIRSHHPSFALISMGTNQVWEADQFEIGMRTIIERLIDQGVVPVLSTKADNLEGDDHINLIVARLSVEYDLPLWNFWRAVQSLPNHGLQKDREHLTYYHNNFGVPESMQFAWPVRNLSALQVLDRLMNESQP